jgi:hypothetical protein
VRLAGDCRKQHRGGESGGHGKIANYQSQKSSSLRFWPLTGEQVGPTPGIADRARSAAPSVAPRPACRSTSAAGR